MDYGKFVFRDFSVKLITSDELGSWCLKGLVGGQMQRAERRYPWQPWKREPPRGTRLLVLGERRNPMTG